MLSYPHIDPVIFRIGPLAVRWYGLMYVLGFLATWLLVRRQIARQQFRELAAHFDNLNFVLLVSLVAGARLGYVFFYNFSYYLRHPLEIVATWEGGMSFHGGLILLLSAGYLYCRRHGLDFWRTADLYVVTVPVGLGLGRLGNFINGELYGRVTEMPWGMIFPGAGPLPRHPSQIYECLLEGLLLFVILWNIRDKDQPGRKWPTGGMLAMFLILYGLFRSFVELFRQPDPQLGFLLGPLTMGQLLSLGMIAGGVFLLGYRKRVPSENTQAG